MKTPQRYHFYQFLVMVVIAVLIAAESIYMLYRTSLDEHQRRLSEMARTHARLIEAVAIFDLEYSGDFPEGSTAATLSQIQQAHRSLSGFGQTGQFLIGLRKQGTLHAVIPLTDADLPVPGVFPGGAPLTRFMDEALNGRSGIGEAVDFRNVPVLAAYEPVKTLGLGLIAKMDVAEIRGPYLQAMFNTSVAAVVILGVGSLGFFLIGTPMLRRWERELRHFSDIIEQRSAQLRQSNQDRDREKTYRRQVETSLREKEDKLEQIQEELQATGHRLEATRLELRTSANSLEKLQTFSRIETAHIGLDGHVQMVTPHLVDLLEYRPEDVQGKPLVELVHPDEASRLKEHLQGMREDASFTFNMELHLKKRSGDWLAVSVHSSPVVSPGSAPDHFLLLVMEAADRETVQREIAQARHLAQSASHSKSLFVSAMSHEIRTPLNAILGYAQIMLRDSHMDADQRKKLSAIQKAGNQLLNLVNEVLDFSRIETGKMMHTPVDFDLVRQVKDLAGLFHIEAVKKGLAWSVDNRLESAKVLVRGDQGKLRQVLISLLENAVKLTDHGDVRFRVFTPEPDRYRFEVIDTGPGLHPEERERIFESFQWTRQGEKKGGLGLGLAVAGRMVALMGGQLEVESEPGRGARFHFTLDLPPARRDVTEKLEPYQTVVALAPGQGVRAVVVDDTPADAEMFAEMLRRLGVRVEVALEGLDGVNRAQESRPDIVFMDYKMPDIDGLEAFRILRAQLGTDMVKTVIISASALDTPAEHFLSEGVHGFVQKPLVREEILEVMHRLLGVQYVYNNMYEQKEQEENQAVLENIDLTALRVPAPLLHDLKQNARLGMFLSMSSNLEALRNIEPHGPALVEQLRHHIDRFDKKKIIHILDALTPA